MRGLILVNAYSELPAFRIQSGRLKEELSAIGIESEIRRNDGLSVCVDGGLSVCTEGFDFCIYLDKDKYVLKALELSGFPVFNCFSAIEACDDKMMTYLLLSQHGIRMAKTVPGLLCYDRNSVIPEETADRLISMLGLPLVVKESYGSMGKRVYLASSKRKLLSIMDRVKCVPHCFQQYIAESAGRDLRVIVVGGKPAGGMIRSSRTDFRSNVGLGGDYSAFEIDEETGKLASRIASVLNLDYCGIDLLFGKDGMTLCEVNSNAFFEAFEKCTQINVAKLYAEHIAEKMKSAGTGVPGKPQTEIK